MKRQMKRAQQGFTLIELMIVVAIIGILAAVALPAYRDYSVRAKASELILAASAGKTTVSEYVNANGQMPSTASLTLPDASSKYVTSVAYGSSAASTGILTVTGSSAETALNGKTLMLTGTVNATGQVDWECRAGTTNPIDTRYLPSSCK